jgi:hypothetical protein
MKGRSKRNPQNNLLNTAEDEMESVERESGLELRALSFWLQLERLTIRSFKLRSAEQVVRHSHSHLELDVIRQGKNGSYMGAAHLTIALPCNNLFASCNAILGLQQFVAHISRSQSDLLHSKAAENSTVLNNVNSPPTQPSREQDVRGHEKTYMKVVY